MVWPGLHPLAHGSRFLGFRVVQLGPGQDVVVAALHKPRHCDDRAGVFLQSVLHLLLLFHCCTNINFNT